MVYDILPINVCVRLRDEKVQIELSKTFTQNSIVRKILDCALRGDTLTIYPEFYPDRIRAWNSLIERGIISVEKDTNTVVYHL